MKHLITFILSGILMISCSNNEDSTQNNEVSEPLLKKITKVVGNSGSLPPSQSEFVITFEYDSNLKLTRKTGGYLAPNPSSGFNNPLFTNQIYTSLIYTGQNVTVEDFASSTNFTVPINTKYFTLNNLNLILTKEVPNNNNNYFFKKQTFNYLNNNLNEIKTTFPNMPFDSNDPNDYILTYLEKFYFDLNSNVIKTEYFEQRNGISKGEKIVRTFENFDNSYNPFKRLKLLDEFFYLSISKNNYRKYKEIHYQDENVGLISETTWSYNYDTNGKIIIN